MIIKQKAPRANQIPSHCQRHGLYQILLLQMGSTTGCSDWHGGAQWCDRCFCVSRQVLVILAGATSTVTLDVVVFQMLTPAHCNHCNRSCLADEVNENRLKQKMTLLTTILHNIRSTCHYSCYHDRNSAFCYNTTHIFTQSNRNAWFFPTLPSSHKWFS